MARPRSWPVLVRAARAARQRSRAAVAAFGGLALAETCAGLLLSGLALVVITAGVLAMAVLIVLLSGDEF